MPSEQIAESGLAMTHSYRPRAVNAGVRLKLHGELVGIRCAETLVLGKNSHSIKSYPWAEGLTPENISRRAVE
jgi:hypothetical protein